MSDVLDGVYDHLIADAAVLAAVPQVRIHVAPMRKQQSLPSITFELVSGTSHGHMGGKSGLANATVQINCVGESNTSASSVGEIVRVAFDRLSGTEGGFVIRSVFAGSPTMTHEAPTSKNDTGRYVYRRDYVVWYTENTS